MTMTRFKRAIRQLLPQPVFKAVQRIRKIGYKPAERVTSLKLVHEGLQADVRPEEIVLRRGITLKIHPESRVPFEWFCWRSPNMVDELNAFLEKSRGAKCFLDTGANQGIFSLAFLRANPGSDAISIDPSPLAHEIRIVNARLNGFESLRCEQVACGNTNAKIRMYFNRHHLEVAPLVQMGEGVEVEMETMDSICARHGVAPEVVKIDVEGFEKQVLEGATKTLRAARVLFLEVHPDLLEKIKIPARDIHQLLTAEGWRIRELNGRDIGADDFSERYHTFWTVCERE